MFLVLMMVSSCLATNRKTLMVETHEQEQRQLMDQKVNPNDDGGGHHYIPRGSFPPHDNGNGGGA